MENSKIMEKVSLTLQNRELIEEIIEKNPDLQARIHNAIVDGVSNRVVKSVCNSPEIKDIVNREQKKYEERILSQLFDKGNYGYGYVLKTEFANKLSENIRERINDELNNGIIRTIREECQKRLGSIKEKIDQEVENTLKTIKEFNAEAYMKERIDEEIKRRLDLIMKG